MKTIRSVAVVAMIAIVFTIGFFQLRAQGQQPTRPPVSGVVQFPPNQAGSGTAPSGSLPGVLSPGVGSNIQINQDLTGQPQNEPSITVNPVNALNLVAGANDYATANGDSGCGFYSSSDGGNTWMSGTPLRGPSFQAAGDPAVAFDSVGNVYYSCLSFNRLPGNEIGANEMRVFKSTDGGRTWPVSAQIAGGTGLPSDFHDKEYLTVDTTGGTYNNNVYVTWAHYSDSGVPIMFSKSTNGGASFSVPTTISDTQNNQFSQPAVGPNGEVYVSWRDYNVNRILLDKSTDGGTTWNALGGDKQVAMITPVDAINALTRAATNPSLAVDAGSGRFRGSVYLVWHDGRYGDADILLSRSSDGGVSWSSPIRVNDDLTGNGKDQIFPWVNVEPDGKINVMWYDRRLDSENRYFHVFFAQSLDGGASFTANVQVATVGSDPCVQFLCDFIGDYLGMASSLGAAHPLWADTRNGNQDVLTASINTFEGLPDLAVTMTDSPDPVTVGTNLSYAVTVTNSGAALATGITLRDTLPPEVDLVAILPPPPPPGGGAVTCGYANGTVSCTKSSLNNGSSFTIRITVKPVQTGSITNTASVTLNQFDPPANNSATVTTQAVPDTTPPTVPANVTATPVNSTRIALSWSSSTDNVGVTGYRIERCQGAGCGTFSFLALVTGTNYNDYPLTTNVSYTYRVLATDAASNLSLPSSPASAAPPSDSAFIGTTQRVSLDGYGGQGDGDSVLPAMTGDGRYIAFSSWASNVVPGDTNNGFDVFLHDRLTGTIERVTVDSSGNEGGNPASGASTVSLSSDGRYVAFDSEYPNLVPGDTNAMPDVFVRDRVVGVTQRVSVSSSGAQGNERSFTPSMSADGRYVVFDSRASNLVAGDTNGVGDIFLRDRQMGVTSAVTQANGGSYGALMSPDGRYVTFSSSAANLTPGDTNAVVDTFIKDLQTGLVERVSVASNGTQGNGASESRGTSADGRFVVFASLASNLVSGDTNGVADIFVRDRVTGTTERVSVDSNGIQGNSAVGFYFHEVSMSSDGRFITFSSDATNLVPGDTNGVRDVFVRDRQTGITERVSLDSTEAQGNGVSDHTAISADGRYVAFASTATNLVPADTNNMKDVFVRYRDMSAVPPTVFTDPASTISQTSATLNGRINPRGTATTAWFEWGMTTSYGSVTSSQSLGGGPTTVAINQVITGLSANTTYHFRAVAENVPGQPVRGADQSFTTLPNPPTAGICYATNITLAGATLNTTVDPNGVSGNAWFEYGTTPSYGAMTTSQPISSPGTVSIPVTGLASNTLYHCRLVVQTSGGTTQGADGTFTTLVQPPVVSTGSATDITLTTATLNGTANPNGVTGTAWFEYGLTTAYGLISASQPISGAAANNVGIPVNGLTSNAMYHYRIAAANNGGTTYGADTTFSTLASQDRLPTSDRNVANAWSTFPNGCGGGGGGGGNSNKYQCVDDPIGSPNNSTDYIRVQNSGKEAIFGFSALTVPSGATIQFVRVTYVAIANGGSANIKAALRVSGNIYTQPTAPSLTPGWAQYNYDWIVNPKTGVAWTAADVNGAALQGMGVYSGSGNESVTQVYMTVWYR